MIIGIGMDLVEVDRMERLLERHSGRALTRLFTAGEVEYCSAKERAAESYAVRFAAKEALFKALGTGLRDGASWHDIEVVTNSAGAPFLRLSGEAGRFAETRGVRSVHVTLTHVRDLAGATVVLEGDDHSDARAAYGA